MRPRTRSARRAASGWRTVALALVALALGACAGTPRRAVLDAIEARDTPRALTRYETLRRDDGPDPALLARIAAVVLAEAALGDDERARDAALLQLALAGSAGEPVLRSVAATRGRLPARARALAILARRGDDDARGTLRRLSAHPDPALAALGVRVLDPREDDGALRAALGNPAHAVRAAAADALAGAAPDPRVRSALAETARVDPEPVVRTAATRALGRFGPAATASLRERLSDADIGVRRAAATALVAADRAEARRVLAPLLALPPTELALDAARLLASDDAAAPDLARDASAWLLRALASGDAALRTGAAVALLSLPGDAARADAVARALAHEADPGVRLLLACALTQRVTPDASAPALARARAALSALLRTGGMRGVQAAAQLATLGDRAGRRALWRATSDANPAIRRVAARALARDARAPDAARAALADPDTGVRIAAAGGILAALAAP